MNHEHTDIYKTALELVDACLPIARRMPPGFGFLGDQLRRASTSVPMLFGEGCRKKSVKERRYSFDGSAGSASEVSSQMDMALRAQAIDEVEAAAVKDKCDHICAMLHKFR